MEQIAENVYIEQGFPRVTLGALKMAHGLVLIDSPFQAEDVHAWQSKLSHLGGGVERLLILLDAHIDRIIAIREMETKVLGHEIAVDIISNYASSSSSREIEVDPESDQQEHAHGSRFAKPNMTFSGQVAIHWGSEPLLITHKPGSHTAGLWVVYEAKKVVFIGDTVVRDQPPFLAFADIDRWIEDLHVLQADRFKDYTIVSSRNGIVAAESILQMIEFLNLTKTLLDDLAEQEKPLKAVPDAASQLLTKIDFEPACRDRYLQRLICGLEHYLQGHYLQKENH